MIRCALQSVGIAAPGLSGWAGSLPVLRGEAPHVIGVEAPYAPALLPPNERRRATATVRQAFRAAEDAITPAGADARTLASVFASSDADLTVLHRICAALAEPQRVISPTDFHNSVHNAASGYWSIAVQSMAPTTSLSAFDTSFAAGLLEAAALLHERQADVLLVAYDTPAPEPLLATRPLGAAAGVALLLRAAPSGACGAFTVELGVGAPTPCARGELEALRGTNPALRALPLLEHIALRREGVVHIEAPGGQSLILRYTP
jgi:hypothetical protein